MFIFNQNKKNLNLLFFLKSLTLLFFVVFFPKYTQAATLSVSPSSGTYTVGKTFTVTFSIVSTTQAVNAVSTNFTYSKDTLEIIGVSKSGSIISLWAPGGDPAYSQSSGTGSFEGIITNPGYTGSFGKIASYTFRVKNSGTGYITLKNAAILANDGIGTNVLTNVGNAILTLVAAEKPVTPTPKPVIPTKAPIPTPKPVELETTPLMTDGILSIQELPKEDNLLCFKIEVRNSTKEIQKYEIRINQNEPIIWEDVNKDGIFKTPLLSSGKYTLLVKVLDINQLITGYIDFTIEALSKPVLLYYTKNSHLGQQPLVAYGTHDTSGTITLLIKKQENVIYSETIPTDQQNRFLFVISDKVPAGEYILELFAQDEFGVSSEHTIPVKIYIKRYPYVDLGFTTLPTGLLILCTTLFAIVGWIIVYIYHKKYTIRG